MRNWLKPKRDESEWKANLEVAKAIFNDTKEEREKMTRHLRLFEGRLWDLKSDEFTSHDQAAGRSFAQFNTIFAAIESIAPMVTDSRPITKVAPRHPWAEKIGSRLNDVIMYSWDALDMQMQTYKAVLDAMIFSTAIFKIGYDEARGRVTLCVIDPRDFFVAPGYETIWEAPFCGVRTPKPLSWVKDMFPEIEEIKGATSSLSGDEMEKAYQFGHTRKANEHVTFVEVYEMWLRDDETIERIVEESDGEKVTKREQKYPFGKIHYFTNHQDLGCVACTDDHGLPPYVEMWDYIRPHNFLGISEVEQIEGIHKEINVLIKYISEHVRRHHAPNYLVDMYQLQDESFEALKSRLSEGNQYIPWDSAGGTKTPPVQQIDDGQLNPQILNLLSFHMEIIDIVNGITDITRGDVGKQERQSASEIAMLMENANTRTRQRVRNLEWSLKRVYYLLLRNVMQYYTEPQSMSYSTGDGRRYFTYGNSYAQAEETMRPRAMMPETEEALAKGAPLFGVNAEDAARYQQEKADYEKFLTYFADREGEFDPIHIDFDIEIQTDSTLPTDKQSRANLFLRLAEMRMIGPKKLFEQLQIPGIEEALAEIKEMSGGGQEPQRSAE